MCPATVWNISESWSRRKNDAAPAPELFYSWTWLQLRSSSFHECGSGSGALFFHGSGSSSGFCSFSHTNVLIVLVFLRLNEKWIKSSAQNQENVPNILSNLIW